MDLKYGSSPQWRFELDLGSGGVDQMTAKDPLLASTGALLRRGGTRELEDRARESCELLGYDHLRNP